MNDRELRAENQRFRDEDDSSLWPICGAFNVAERAIRKARAFAPFSSAYEYRCCLEGIASDIVNNSKNW